MTGRRPLDGNEPFEEKLRQPEELAGEQKTWASLRIARGQAQSNRELPYPVARADRSADTTGDRERAVADSRDRAVLTMTYRVAGARELAQGLILEVRSRATLIRRRLAASKSVSANVRLICWRDAWRLY